MANRYWVGGTGTWNTSNTTNWSATSGGAGGASVPTSADLVYFDANSGTGTVTILGTYTTPVNTGGINFSGSPSTLLLQGQYSYSQIYINVYNGDFVASSTWKSVNYATLFYFMMYGTGTRSFNPNNHDWNASGIYFNVYVNQGTVNQAGNFTNAFSCGIYVGRYDFADAASYNTNGYGTGTSGPPSIFAVRNATITIGSGTQQWNLIEIQNYDGNTINITNPTTFAGTIRMYAGTLNLNVSSSTMPFNFEFYNSSRTATVNFNNSTFKLTGLSKSNSTGTITLNPGTSTVYVTDVKGIWGTWNNFVSSGSTYNWFSIDGSLTVNGSMSVTVPNDVNTTMLYRYLVCSSNIGQQATLTMNGTRTFTCVDFRDISVSGTALTGTRLGDGGGNANITFPASKTYYGIGTGGNWYSYTSWSLTSGGTAAQDGGPICHDDVVLDANSNGATWSLSGPRSICRNLTITSGFTSSVSVYGELYGNLTLGANMTGSFPGAEITLSKGGSNPQYNITSNGKTFSKDLLVLNGTMNIMDTFNATNASVGLSSNSAYGNIINSSFVTNNNTINSTYLNLQWSSTASGTINLGSSAITTKYMYTGATRTDFTFNAGTSQIDLTAQDQTSNNQSIYTNFPSGYGITLNKVSCLSGTAGYGVYINNSGVAPLSINELIVPSGTARTVKFRSQSTYNIGKWTGAGSSGNLITIKSNDTQQHTLNYTGVGKVALDYLSVSYSTATPTFTWYSGKNSTLSNTTGWNSGDPSYGNGLFFGSNF